jgi:beta-lactamase regulating signal transducer with metallopeptidase domain
MNPDLLLSVVAAFAGFVLKTTLAFGVCLLLHRLTGSPKRRFVIWSVFLFGAAAYWIFLANSFLAAGPSPASAPHGFSQPVNSNVGAWQIPDSWGFPLGLALRAAGIVYLLTLSSMLLTHIRKRRQLKWVLGFTSKPPSEIAETFQTLAESLHVGRSRLLVLSGATSPATFGWIRPTILLPTVCLEQDRSELEDILRHELHHVRRWDSVWNGFALACRALLCFHPAAWYAVRKMQFDRELACDLAVVSHSPARKGEYAECLIRFARLNLVQDPKNWGIDFAASAEDLTVRVHSILAEANQAPGWLVCLRVVSGVTLSALFLGVVPSLAILLSYAHRPVSQPWTAAIQALPSETRTPAKTTRKFRTLSSASPANAAVARLSDTESKQPMMDSPLGRETENPSSLQTSPGPKLLHRGAAPSGHSASVNKSQTVALIDTDASGESGKSGDHDGKQALQQSATAALGLYRRLSELDRH